MIARRKIFVVGANKTGTTSLGVALDSLGFKVGDQNRAEFFMEDWGRRDFRGIIKYCRAADAFQDRPFSLDYTYQAMDMAFPGSRFILSIRHSSQEWYESFTRYQTKIVGKGRLPTSEDLKEFKYRSPGWMWRTHQLVFGIDEQTLYDPDIYIKYYENQNERVRDYFRHRPEDLLVLNVAEPDAMKSLCEFLRIEWGGRAMPHTNRSQ